MFNDTPRFREALSIIDKCSTSKLHRFLSLIVEIVTKKRSSLTPEELSEFPEALRVSEEEFSTLHSACYYILEQCIYIDPSVEDLSSELSSLGLSQKKLNALLDIWTNNSEQLLLTARDRHLAGRQYLANSSWKLSGTVAHTDQSSTFIPNVLLNLELTDGRSSVESHSLQFNKEQLESLFQNIEDIAAKVDSL
ncbi:hypothetical protein GEMRC1_002580 [Eukaryota sp. GEM-RC1]